MGTQPHSPPGRPIRMATLWGPYLKVFTAAAPSRVRPATTTRVMPLKTRAAAFNAVLAASAIVCRRFLLRFAILSQANQVVTEVEKTQSVYYGRGHVKDVCEVEQVLRTKLVRVAI